MGKVSKKSILYLQDGGPGPSEANGLASEGGFPYNLIELGSVEEMEKALEQRAADAALLHLRTGDTDLFQLLETHKEMPFVVLAEAGSERLAARALRSGAVDYVVRDEQGEYLATLSNALQRAVEKRQVERERNAYQRELEEIVSDRTQVLLEANQRLTQETQQRLEFMEALRESETRYTMIFNSASDAIFVHDLQGSLLDVNDKACENLGYTRAELLEMSVEEILAGEDIFTPLHNDELREEGHLLMESEYHTKDGSTIPVELSSRIMDYRGQKAVVTIARDVSQRRKVEKALEESEEKYRRFFQTSQDAVFMTTSGGQWVDMNQAAVELFGFDSKEELMEVNIHELYPQPEDREKHTAIIEKQGFTRNYRQTLHKKSGEEFPALITSTLYEAGDEVLGYQGTIRDLSQEQKIEAQRRKSARQQEEIDALTSELRSTLDLEEMYESILHHLDNLFPMDYFLLFKVDGERVELKYGWGSGEPLDTDYFPQISSLSGDRFPLLEWVLQEGQPVSDPDLADREGKSQGHYQFDAHGKLHRGGSTQLSGGLTRSSLLVPLIADEEAIGVLEIQSFDEDAYDKRDQELLRRIANTIAIGLQKSYLLDSYQKQNQRLKSLHIIDRAITENQSLPMMLDTLRDQLVSMLEVDAADILFLHPELEVLKIITQTGFRTNPLKYTNLQLGEGPAGEAASSRETVFIADIPSAGREFQRSPDFDQEEFVSYVGVPLLAKGDLVGVLEVFHRERLDVDHEWMDFLKTLAGQAAIAIDQRNLYKNMRRSKEKLDEAYDSIIESWAQAMELREIETKGHAQRLVDLTLKIARRMGVEEDELDDIRRGAYLHDVGKMGIPDRILNKEEKLTPEEREEIGQHPLYAFEILKSNDYLKPALDIPLYHHERWDGMGYPEGLEEEEIPLSSRIFAVVDVWDALRSGRPYRSAWSDGKALAHIKEESGKHFDPQVVKVFLEIIQSQDKS